MSSEVIGLLGIGGLVVLLLLRVPIAFALAGVSFVGITTILGTRPALGILSAVTYEFAASWTLSAIPMFLMMGYVCYHAGLTRGLFDACRAWLSRLPGGVAVAAVFGAAGFAATTGSSIACAAAMGRISIPEMIRMKYDPALATGAVAAAGTLGALIPPSILLILFGIFAEVHIGKLFLGGMGVGLLSVLGYASIIMIRAKLNPELAPLSDEKVSMRERVDHLRSTWPLIVIVVIIIGGMFSGLFTTTEAGAVGALASIGIAVVKRAFSLKILYASIVETLATSGAIFVIAIAANMLTRFLALSGAGELITSLIIGMEANPTLFLIAVAVIYLLLGMFLEPIGAMLLTLPILLPVLDSAGISLIWFGVFMAKLLEVGMITPPIGINVFVIKGVVGNAIKLTTIFRGILWFVAADIVVLGLMIAFPQLITFLPSLMSR